MGSGCLWWGSLRLDFGDGEDKEIGKSRNRIME